MKKKNNKLENIDHRNLNLNLKYFFFNEEAGQGFPFWLPEGKIIKNILKSYLKKKEEEFNYQEVETPTVINQSVYEKSGHLSHYQDYLFPVMIKGNDKLRLRPMSCPSHFFIYKKEIRSYKELPLRFSENAFLYRYESSGSLKGIERTRIMELSDAHIFLKLDQLFKEFDNCYFLIKSILDDLKIKISSFSLSFHDPENKSKFFDNKIMWKETEFYLENLLKKLNLKSEKKIGEAAFYGPKLDIQIETIQGNEITISTIQLDFVLAKKFGLNYINEDNKKQTPIIIHRSLIGTYERFVSILLEQNQGKLPFWLSPVQIYIISLSLKFNDYCQEVSIKLKKSGFRCKLNLDSLPLKEKIKNVYYNKYPYYLVFGQNEIKEDLVTFSHYDDYSLQKKIKFNLFLEKIKNEFNPLIEN